MKIFPASTLDQLEFNKVKSLLAGHCRTEFAVQKATQLRIHTQVHFIERALQQTHEFKSLLQTAQYFPNDFAKNIKRELKLLGIPGATLSAEQFIALKKLAENTQQVFRWFDDDHRQAYPALAQVIEGTYYEKAIKEMIEGVLDDGGEVRDSASTELAEIRMKLYRKRNEQRRLFDKIVSRLNKLGYLTDIEESFMNGRRVLAVFAEQKRLVKGVLHSESESRRTSFIEPEETTEINNEIFSLEYKEEKEITRILQELTKRLAVFSTLLNQYFILAGEFDFIRAKALLALDINGHYPMVKDKAHIHLVNACHPLLYLYNSRAGKSTIPLSLTLDAEKRILVISGPNAGGKTVTLKTVGLLQIMLQAGLLVSASPQSEFGIFKQLFIHMGDEQNLEFELSTYSSHLTNMKYFIENANGKTLFFIDELGSGSDPSLGGAFAEVIMEELAYKHALGIVTTHYLNLKVMVGRVKGIINGAMQFDEQKLAPLYKLLVGKPGSSYTFSIAERIGLPQKLISRARRLVDENHFTLDTLLNRTEQDLQQIDKEKDTLAKLLKENERLKHDMQMVINKELHRQQVEKLKYQNHLSEEKIHYLKDMERRLKALVIEWRKSEQKEDVIKMIHALLFKQKDKMVVEKNQKKLNEKYIEIGGTIQIGQKVKMKNNRSVGIVKEMRGKKAILQVGAVPITVNITDLVAIADKPVS
ncbi:MAG: DNA mismatch repair protein MutS [Niastella sp. SCN 39-18]|nr:hypothetical protein [Sphingobacteriales bacterium]ODT53807.1 MAG: DNA mismatch repair protein MutS [Niastella sp. SCN 39-18]OJW07627.1 MAG: DNA mismatch repair protein MutS [Sphingobacteriales bacterium 39-19]